ncbi:MAG: FAD-dependent oxidoreductase [Acidimicrobiales bacterium]|nr:FAD-dependent oxidoreductase [Acidimicrobiales bacterium]
MDSPSSDDVLVLGAGLAGLTCARTLVDAGHSPLVVDKGRSVGGRLATRRIGDATLDHGAQFFTVRGADFAAEVGRAEGAGVVAPWCHGFGDPPDGFARYRAEGGMNRWAKWLAEGLAITTGVEIERLTVDNGRFVAHHGDHRMSASHLVATAPVPQLLTLLERGGVDLAPDVTERLGGIRYHRTLALLATVDGPAAIPEPGGVQLDDGPFSFVADNQAKGISAAPAVTFHASHAVSDELFDRDDADAIEALLDHATRWLGNASVADVQLKRWRYAGPVTPDPDPCVVTEIDGATLVVAGDAFAGPKVEGAFNSGRAAATALLS